MKSQRSATSPLTSRISVFFFILGILSLVFSIYSTSQIFALIGLGLVFWGALFVLMRPLKLVEATLLYKTSIATYLTTDRIINDLGYTGKAYYIPPYPEDVYVPEYLKGLKASVVFISAKDDGEMPSIEDMARGKFLSKGKKGVLLVPPGSGILTQIEDKTKTNFTDMSLDKLCDIMPTFILQDLSLVKDLTMEIEGDQVHLTMVNSIYKDLYSSKSNLKSIDFLGCPIVSAVACAIAKTSGQPVTIQKIELSGDDLDTQVWYQMLRSGVK